MGRFIDYYEVLQVHPKADADVIAKAYRVLVAKHHPDKGGDEEHCKLLNVAYERLSDPKKRAEYDKERTAAVGGSAAAGRGGPSRPPAPVDSEPEWFPIPMSNLSEADWGKSTDGVNLGSVDGVFETFMSGLDFSSLDAMKRQADGWVYEKRVIEMLDRKTDDWAIEASAGLISIELHNIRFVSAFEAVIDSLRRIGRHAKANELRETIGCHNCRTGAIPVGQECPFCHVEVTSQIASMEWGDPTPVKRVWQAQQAERDREERERQTEERNRKAKEAEAKRAREAKQRAEEAREEAHQRRWDEFIVFASGYLDSSTEALRRLEASTKTAWIIAVLAVLGVPFVVVALSSFSISVPDPGLVWTWAGVCTLWLLTALALTFRGNAQSRDFQSALGRLEEERPGSRDALTDTLYGWADTYSLASGVRAVGLTFTAITLFAVVVGGVVFSGGVGSNASSSSAAEGAEPAVGSDASGESMPTVVMPDLVGMTESSAGDQLEALGLRFIVSPRYSDEIAVGTVCGTEPSAGGSVDEGTAVAVFISEGPKPAPQAQPTDDAAAVSPDVASTAEQLIGVWRHEWSSDGGSVVNFTETEANRMTFAQDGKVEIYDPVTGAGWAFWEVRAEDGKVLLVFGGSDRPTSMRVEITGDEMDLYLGGGRQSHWIRLAGD